MAAKKKQSGAAVGDALASLRDKLGAKFGKNTAIIPAEDDPMSNVKGVVPCGIDVVDNYVMGLGGAALGKVMEVFSEPGVSKTTWLWTLLGGCVRAGGLVVYCDNERSYNPERAAMFGLPADGFLLLQPWTLEEALMQMHEAVQKLTFNGPVMLAWDSLGGSQFEGDLKNDYNKTPQDTRAMDTHKFCRAMIAETGKRKLGVVIINQTRHKRGVMFGSDITTPGGDGPKFAASLRMQMFGGKSLKNAVGQHVGKAVTFLEIKSRFSPPFRKAKVRLDYEHGWDNTWSTLNLAKDLGLVPKGVELNEAGYNRAVDALREWARADAPKHGIDPGPLWANPAPWAASASSAADVTDEDDGLTDGLEGDTP